MKGIGKFIQRVFERGTESSRKGSVFSRYVTNMSSALVREVPREKGTSCIMQIVSVCSMSGFHFKLDILFKKYVICEIRLRKVLQLLRLSRNEISNFISYYLEARKSKKNYACDPRP